MCDTIAPLTKGPKLPEHYAVMNSSSTSSSVRLFLRLLLRPALCIPLLLLMTVSLLGSLRLQRRAEVGLPASLPPLNPQMVVPQRGVNVELQQYADQELWSTLAQTREAGFSWVRQTFPWADIEPQSGRFVWGPWDRIVEAADRQGLQLIAVLDTSPVWARSRPSDAIYTPPHEVADFGHFARAFTLRYGHRIDYYQVWDEPNLSDHWGGTVVDAEAYTRLLREAAIQIRSADPVAWILTAGLAPTVETGPLNINAPGYLDGIYSAGGRPYFDIVAAKCYGFEYDAWDRRLESGLLNFSRVQFLRQAMERRGDTAKPIWAVEFGWNSLPSEWEGAPSVWRSVSSEEQIAYTLGALARADREWPWMGAMILATWQPDASPDDPVWGFALVDRQGRPRPLLEHLRKQAASASPVAHVGRYPPDHPTGHYEGRWQVTPEGADIGSSGDRLIIAFQGTRLDLTVRKGNYWALLYVAIDGKATDTLPRTDGGRSYVVLYSPEPRTVQVPLARYLLDGDHTAEIEAEGGWGQWAIAGWSVHREADTRPYVPLRIMLALGLLLTIPLAAYHIWCLPWPQWIAKASTRYGTIPPVLPQVLSLAGAAVFYFGPSLPLSLPGLTMLTLSLLLAPSTGLPVVALAIPFYRQPKQVMGKLFSMTEIATLLTLAAWATRQLLAVVVSHWRADARTRPGDLIASLGEDLGSRLDPLVLRLRCLGLSRPDSQAQQRGDQQWGLTSLDAGMMALGFASVVAVFVAQEKRVALRELRTVVLEPLLFYLLLRTTLSDRGRLWWVVDAWALGGLTIAVWGLMQFAAGQGVIAAEGVWRVRGPYGSPNNLALMLGRQIPLLIAVSAFGRGRWRRLAYGLTLVPVIAAFGLTYSRAGWLVGLPFSLLFLGAVRGGWAAWSAVGALIAGALGSIPVLGAERLRSLLNPHQGTLFFRLSLWRSSVAMIRDHPLLGVGLDNFLYQYRSRYILPSAWQEPDLSHPHNLVLEFWTRLGLLGVAVLAWVEMLFFRRAWRLYRGLTDGDSRALVLGLMAAMVNVLSHGLADNGFFVIDLAYAFCLIVGLLAQVARYEN